MRAPHPVRIPFGELRSPIFVLVQETVDRPLLRGIGACAAPGPPIGATANDQGVTMFSTKSLTALTLTSLVAIAPSALYAQEANSLVRATPKLTKHYMGGGVQVQVTDKGLKYFEQNLDQLLIASGLSLNQGELPKIDYTFGKPMQFSELGLDDETQKLLEQTIGMFQMWIIGNPLRSDVQPTIQIAASSYQASFDKISVVTRPDILQQLGLKNGVVLLLDLKLKDLKLSTSSIKVFDQRMPDLGAAEMTDVEARVGADDLQMKLRVPFYVSVNANHEIEFKALKVEQNLSELPIAVKYKNLSIPQLAIQINGKSFLVDTEKLKGKLDENLAAVIDRTKGEIARFAEEQLPLEINKMAKDILKGQLEEVSKIDPPGATGSTAPFYWGFQVERLSQGRFGLNMTLNAFVEDPQNPASTPDPKTQAVGAPDLANLDGSKFDVILSINQGVVNRLMQLSFQRKAFEAMETGKGPMRLTRVPVIGPASKNHGLSVGRGETVMKVRVQGNVPKGLVSGFQKLGIRDGFEMAFDMNTKLRKVRGGGVEVVFASIDLDSIWINPDHITGLGSIFGGTVRSGVRAEIAKINADWRVKEQKLPGVFPIPPEVMGIKLEIGDMTMSSTGHLLMFLNYKQR